MIRSMSVIWAGRPSRPAATSWLQRRATGIRLRKPARRWRPTWSASTPYLSWSSSFATWKKVIYFFTALYLFLWIAQEEILQIIFPFHFVRVYSLSHINVEEEKNIRLSKDKKWKCSEVQWVRGSPQTQVYNNNYNSDLFVRDLDL